MASRSKFHELVQSHGLTDVVFPFYAGDVMFHVIVVTASEESLAVIATFPVVKNINDVAALVPA